MPPDDLPKGGPFRPFATRANRACQCRSACCDIGLSYSFYARGNASPEGGHLIRYVTVRTPGNGLHEITAQVQAVVHASGVREGLCTVMIQHTSASLIIQENADPSARRDLEEWLRRHVPEGDRHFTHTHEGADDMPSHIRSALTATSLSIPSEDGQLTLGTWQGIYLWEHRARGSNRRCVIHVSS